MVNTEIRKNVDSTTEVLAIDDAKQRGAVHMFGEKYGEKVRVVRIGSESLEFCGGTHVRRAGDIGLFKIISEAGIAQGVRRIEAVTGAGALAYLQKLEADLARTAAMLRRGPGEVPQAVEKLLADLRAKERTIADLTRKAAVGAPALLDVKEIDGVRVLAQRTDVADPKALREVGDQLRDKHKLGVLVLMGVAEGKVTILTMVAKELTSRFHAGKLAGAVAEVVGGRGGGRPDMAQAGGSDPSKVDQALEKVFEFLKAA
jgi:alanyl-tRNA synthetase